MEERHFTNTVEFDRDGHTVARDGVCVPAGRPGTISYRNGLKVRTFTVPPKIAAKPNTSFGHHLEGHDAWFSAPGCTQSETLYDAEDRPTELRLLNARGRVLNRVTLKRDQAGHVIEEHQRGNAGVPWHVRLLFMIATRRTAPFTFSRYFAYDEEGRRKEVRSTIGALSEERQTFEYNAHGEIVVQKMYSVDRSISTNWRLQRKLNADQRHEGETRFEYVYDAHGNWTERTTLPKGSEKPSSRDARTITYRD